MKQLSIFFILMSFVLFFSCKKQNENMFLVGIKSVNGKIIPVDSLIGKPSEKIVNGSFLENDIDGISFADPSPILACQNQLFYIKEAADIVEQKKDGKYIYENIPKLRNLNENDNPVIVIAYLKAE